MATQAMKELKEFTETENWAEDLAEEFDIEESSYSYDDIADGLWYLFDRYTDPKEIEIINNTLISLCGWSLNTLINNVKNKREEN